MIRTFALTASLLATAATAQAATPSAVTPIARDIAAKLLPAGTYQKMMSGTMSQVMDGATEQMSTMPLAMFLKGSGLPQQDIDKLGSASIKQIMAIVDPAYQQRTHIMMTVMMDEFGNLMGSMEPSLRDGLAEAYAHRFTTAQLADIDHFLNTPSGSAYASQAMLIQTDPAVMTRMKAFMPRMMEAMPAIMQKVQAETASLPKPKTAATLTPADRDALARLLGVPAEQLVPKSKETPS